MKVGKAVEIAIDLMERYKLDKWKLVLENSKTTLGACSKKQKEIYLSYRLIKVLNEKEVRDTILHEIAHALVKDGVGHSKIWKNKAVEIGAKPKAKISKSLWHKIKDQL